MPYLNLKGVPMGWYFTVTDKTTVLQIFFVVLESAEK